jgi:hypothetical protein
MHQFSWLGQFARRRFPPAIAAIAIWFAPIHLLAQGSPVRWQLEQSLTTPADGAIVGGPGNAPEHGAPLYVCRAPYQGGTQPGKWVKWNCNITYDSKEVVARLYEVAYGQAGWRPYNGSSSDLLQTGNEANGSPLYSCRVQYHDHGYQPGKLTGGKCDIPWSGKEVVQKGPFEALYVTGGGGPYVAAQGGAPSGASGQVAQGHSSGGGLFGKLVANAQYQQAKQNGASDAQLEAIKQGGNNGDKPPCRSEDPNAHLENGQWVGPHCLAEPDNGHYVTDEEAKKQNEDLRKQQVGQASQGDQEKRADFIESHSCMTTDGADKANALAADCQKVADHSDKACNIQENSCDEIRKATQKGCWGKGAEGPDWCLTRYN